jgi:hypothetical protein
VASVEAYLPPESTTSKDPPPDYRISEAEQNKKQSDQSGPALPNDGVAPLQASMNEAKERSDAFETAVDSDIHRMPSPEKLVAPDQPPLVTELSTPLSEVIVQANPLRQTSKSRISLHISLVTMGFMALLLALWYAGGPSRPDIPATKMDQGGHGLEWIRGVWSERLQKGVDVVKKEGWWDGMSGLVRRA